MEIGVLCAGDVSCVWHGMVLSPEIEVLPNDQTTK